MEQVLVALFLLLVVFGLLSSGIWVAVSLLGVGAAGIFLFTSAPVGKLMATTVWSASGSWALTALPLFVWMAEILYRTRLADDMFSGLAPWLVRLPGRLLHVNIIGCGIFAAVCGSSSATAATIGKISVPELSRRGYHPQMMICTLAGSGTLGLLIPPSVVLIVYGFVTETSIARLFMAGILPGAMLVVLFMGYTALWALINPSKTPPGDLRLSEMGWVERLWGLRRLGPAILLIIAVLGSIYAGFATPTEAAAIGVAGALGLAIASGTLSWRSFMDSLLGATRTSCFCMFILMGAAFLTLSMGFTGIPRLAAEAVIAMELSRYELLLLLTLLYLLLGCFLDGFSMIVLTMGVLQPILVQMGIDLVWYGIFLTIVVEAAQLTPPVGFNLFVLQQYTGYDILYVARAALPFFFVLLLSLVIIVIFPEIVLYLPNRIIG